MGVHQTSIMTQPEAEFVKEAKAGDKNTCGSILRMCWSENFYFSNKSIIKNYLLVPVGGFEPVDYRTPVGSF
jgi:hypothetical protein